MLKYSFETFYHKNLIQNNYKAKKTKILGPSCTVLRQL